MPVAEMFFASVKINKLFAFWNITSNVYGTKLRLTNTKIYRDLNFLTIPRLKLKLFDLIY